MQQRRKVSFRRSSLGLRGGSMRDFAVKTSLPRGLGMLLARPVSSLPGASYRFQMGNPHNERCPYQMGKEVGETVPFFSQRTLLKDTSKYRQNGISVSPFWAITTSLVMQPHLSFSSLLPFHVVITLISKLYSSFPRSRD